AVLEDHPRQGLLRCRAPPLGGVRFRPLRRQPAARGRPAGWPAHHPRRAPARGVHARAGRLRPPHHRLRRGGQGRGLPQRLRHGPLVLRPGRPGRVLAPPAHAAARGAMIAAVRALLALLVLASSGCASLSTLERDQAAAVAAQARSVVVACDAADACARPSPLRALGERAMAESRPGQPRHYALLLDYGQDALVARLDLIRAARRSIDLQTYIFDEDDAGRLVIDELLAAARRGVRVRVLVDQLSALRHVDTLAALAAAHVNFDMRIYNPVLGRARLSYPQYVLAAACCWRQLNRRMHNKEFLIDGVLGITGGRNYQDRYFDWDPDFNFRDRDILVAGPVTAEMAANFEAFWQSPRAVPIAELTDVARHLLANGAQELPQAQYRMPQRVEAISRDADDAQLVATRLAGAAITVGDVEFIADPPEKHRAAWEEDAPATVRLREIIEGAQDEVLLQTPYLVLSRPAREMFAGLHAREDGPRVVVSTNSLAATDSFITYAMSYKYR